MSRLYKELQLCVSFWLRAGLSCTKRTAWSADLGCFQGCTKVWGRIDNYLESFRKYRFIFKYHFLLCSRKDCSLSSFTLYVAWPLQCSLSRGLSLWVRDQRPTLNGVFNNKWQILHRTPVVNLFSFIRPILELLLQPTGCIDIEAVTQPLSRSPSEVFFHFREGGSSMWLSLDSSFKLCFSPIEFHI